MPVEQPVMSQTGEGVIKVSLVLIRDGNLKSSFPRKREDGFTFEVQRLI
jgi:hypothetical protein